MKSVTFPPQFLLPLPPPEPNQQSRVFPVSSDSVTPGMWEPAVCRGSYLVVFSCDLLCRKSSWSRSRPVGCWWSSPRPGLRSFTTRFSTETCSEKPATGAALRITASPSSPCWRVSGCLQDSMALRSGRAQALKQHPQSLPGHWWLFLGSVMNSPHNSFCPSSVWDCAGSLCPIRSGIKSESPFSMSSSLGPHGL